MSRTVRIAGAVAWLLMATANGRALAQGQREDACRQACSDQESACVAACSDDDNPVECADACRYDAFQCRERCHD